MKRFFSSREIAQQKIDSLQERARVVTDALEQIKLDMKDARRELFYIDYPISWKNTFNSLEAEALDAAQARHVAGSCKYKYFVWDGKVYDVNYNVDTGVKASDLD
jgi:uncharacterized UPF0160 family protein